MNIKKVLASILVLIMAAAPALSYARAGGSFSSSRSYSAPSRSWSSPSSSSRPSGSMTYNSMGSRGSQTYAPTRNAAPITQSMTPRQSMTTNSTRPATTATPSTRTYAPTPSYTPSYNAPVSTGSSGSFWAGLGGGFLGSWIGNSMFGHSSAPVVVNGGGAYPSAAGGGYVGGAGAPGTVVVNNGSSGGGFFSGLFTLIFIVLIIAGAIWLIRRINRNNSNEFSTITEEEPMTYAYESVTPVTDRSVSELTSTDRDDFNFVHKDIQNAWSEQNVEEMRKYLTAEMFSYFDHNLRNNMSQGVINVISNYSLVSSNPTQYWQEGDEEYVTVDFVWNAVDYVKDSKTSDVVDGDANKPVEAREFWTFCRQNGGYWILTAIQQAQ